MTFLRGRPWLPPCLLTIFLGGMVLVTASDDSNPTFQVVIGLLAILSGVLMFASAEHATLKRRNASPQPSDPDVHMPPTL